MPPLIVWAWVVFLFPLAEHGGARRGFGPRSRCAGRVLTLVMLLVNACVALFNRPKFLIPPHARNEAGFVNR
jgi:hypothetical protein